MAETIDPEPLLAGWFKFYFADERWEWSPETQRIHGYEPGTVTPTTDLVMSHKHPDDLAAMTAHLDTVRRTHQAVSTRHRIVDARGRTRDVVVAGQEIVDDDGVVIGTSGVYVDVTPTPLALEDSARTRERTITDKVAAVVEGRAVIDATKGMLMLIYGNRRRQGLRPTQVAVPGDERQAAPARRTAGRGIPRSHQRRSTAAASHVRQDLPHRPPARGQWRCGRPERCFLTQGVGTEHT